jgi:hypothetical protein
LYFQTSRKFAEQVLKFRRNEISLHQCISRSNHKTRTKRPTPEQDCPRTNQDVPGAASIWPKMEKNPVCFAGFSGLLDLRLQPPIFKVLRGSRCASAQATTIESAREKSNRKWRNTRFGEKSGRKWRKKLHGYKISLISSKLAILRSGQGTTFRHFNFNLAFSC